MATTKGVWKLQEVRDQLLAGTWVTYDPSKDPGLLWVWGKGGATMGINSELSVSSMVQVPGTQWVNFSTLGARTLATKLDGTLWTWGSNSNGALGDGTVIPKSSPVQIPGTQWTKIATGGSFSVAIKSDGTMWSWGYNSDRLRLGDGTQINRSSPIQIPGTTWCGVSAGNEHASACKADGTMWMWGMNDGGQIGNGSTSTGAAVQALPGTWSMVCPAQGNTFGVKTDGTLWAWGFSGNNYYGMLGTNEKIHRSSPTQVPGNQWAAVSSRSDSTQAAATKTDGTLWAWGTNQFGNLGNNATGDRCSPIQVPGNQWCAINVGTTTTSARKTDGTVWVWGRNQYSALLGDNTSTYGVSSPIQLPGTQWVDHRTTSYRSMAKKQS